LRIPTLRLFIFRKKHPLGSTPFGTAKVINNYEFPIMERKKIIMARFNAILRAIGEDFMVILG
jgi:hypothetical protein